MNQEEKYEILKREVDLLQIQVAQEHKPWYRKTSNLIAVLALVFSFGTTGVSYYKSWQEDVRANRREARELIQRLTKLPIENFDLMKRYEGNPQGEILSGAINQENILLATQAVELLRRYPESFSSTEYYAVAFALSQSNLNKEAPVLLEAAMERAADANDYNVAARAYAAFKFSQGNLEEGRRYYEKALSVWERFPERNRFVVDSIDLTTLIYWSQSEMFGSNYDKALELVTNARRRLNNIPASPQRDALDRQVSFVENAVIQAKGAGTPPEEALLRQ